MIVNGERWFVCGKVKFFYIVEGNIWVNDIGICKYRMVVF